MAGSWLIFVKTDVCVSNMFFIHKSIRKYTWISIISKDGIELKSIIDLKRNAEVCNKCEISEGYGEVNIRSLCGFVVRLN